MNILKKSLIVVGCAAGLTGSLVRAMDSRKIDAFFVAAYTGNLTDLQMAYDKNNKLVNCTNRAGNTPLMVAIQAGHLETVRWLLDHDADVSVKNSYNATAATLAVISADERILEAVLPHCTIETINTAIPFELTQGVMSYATPLLACLKSEHNKKNKKASIKLLLEHGAGDEQSLAAAQKFFPEYVDHIQKNLKALKKPQAKEGETKKQAAKMADVSQSAGPGSSMKPSASTTSGISKDTSEIAAFCNAAALGDIATLEKMHKKNKKLICSGDPTRALSSALMLAAGSDQTKAVDWLLAHGADANYKSAINSTVLMCARNKDMMHLLLPHCSLETINTQINVQVPQAEGSQAMTCLASALVKRSSNTPGATEQIGWLLDRGAADNVSLAIAQGLAKIDPTFNYVNRIQENLNKLQKQQRKSTKAEKKKEAKKDEGPHLTTQQRIRLNKELESLQDSPSTDKNALIRGLVEASAAGNIKQVQRLLNFKNKPNVHGYIVIEHGPVAPMYAAMTHNHPEIVALLLEHGAANEQVLHYATQHCPQFVKTIQAHLKKQPKSNGAGPGEQSTSSSPSQPEATASFFSLEDPMVLPPNLEFPEMEQVNPRWIIPRVDAQMDSEERAAIEREMQRQGKSQNGEHHASPLSGSRTITEHAAASASSVAPSAEESSSTTPSIFSQSELDGILAKTRSRRSQQDDARGPLPQLSDEPSSDSPSTVTARPTKRLSMHEAIEQHDVTRIEEIINDGDIDFGGHLYGTGMNCRAWAKKCTEKAKRSFGKDHVNVKNGQAIVALLKKQQEKQEERARQNIQELLEASIRRQQESKTENKQAAVVSPTASESNGSKKKKKKKGIQQESPTHATSDAAGPAEQQPSVAASTVETVPSVEQVAVFEQQQEAERKRQEMEEQQRIEQEALAVEQEEEAEREIVRQRVPIKKLGQQVAQQAAAEAQQLNALKQAQALFPQHERNEQAMNNLLRQLRGDRAVIHKSAPATASPSSAVEQTEQPVATQWNAGTSKKLMKTLTEQASPKRESPQEEFPPLPTRKKPITPPEVIAVAPVTEEEDIQQAAPTVVETSASQRAPAAATIAEIPRETVAVVPASTVPTAIIDPTPAPKPAAQELPVASAQEPTPQQEFIPVLAQMFNNGYASMGQMALHESAEPVLRVPTHEIPATAMPTYLRGKLVPASIDSNGMVQSYIFKLDDCASLDEAYQCMHGSLTLNGHQISEEEELHLTKELLRYWLPIAIKRNNQQEIQRCIAGGVDLNMKTASLSDTPVTPLTTATYCGRAAIMRSLLDHKADVAESESDMYSPWDIADCHRTERRDPRPLATLMLAYPEAEELTQEQMIDVIRLQAQQLEKHADKKEEHKGH